MKQKEAVQAVAALLNQALEADRDSVSRMIKAHRPTTQRMLNHGEIICGGTEPFPTIGVLGIINGVLRCLHGPKARVAVSQDENGTILKFTEYTEPT